MKKIAVFDPYLDVLGGGEKHILSIVKVFEEYGYIVNLLWDDPYILERLKKQLNIEFKNAQVVPHLTASSLIQRLMKTSNYDYFFYVTDGSYFFSLARHNYIFSMYPQASLYRPTWFNRLKWSRFEFIANSPFTKSFIDRWTGKKSQVIYPYIDVSSLEEVQSLKKDQIILTIGRFFKHLHSKRQDIMIKAFKQLQHKHQLFKHFKLYLVGGLKEKDEAYFKELKTLAEDNQNIVFLPNASHDVVSAYYKKALFYWHAAGYGVDERLHPEAVEHLGTAPLEAMAAGCITFCHQSGGPKELITHGQNGFLYHTADELISQTVDIYGEQNKRESVSKNAYKHVKEHFDYEAFKDKIISYFNLTNN